MLGLSQETGQRPRQFSVFFLSLVPGSRCVCVCVCVCAHMCVCACVYTCTCVLYFLQPSYKSLWLSSQLWGLVFQMLDPRAGVLSMGHEPITPQGGSLSQQNPLLFCVPCWAIGPDLFLLPSYQTPCGSFFTAMVVEKPFCQSPVSFQQELLHV